MKKKFIAMLTMGILTAGIFSGCNELKKDTIIPGDVISKAMSAYEKPKSYYGEAKMEISENGKTSENDTIKEWADNSNNKIRRRTEVDSKQSGKVVSTNDGSKMLIYMEKEKKAMTMKADGDLTENSVDYKSQLMKGLNAISKTHTLIYKGEETVNGFKTYHIFAKPKQEKSLIGEVNYWIDKDSWFVVKNTSENANSKSSVEYTKLDFSPKLDDSLFTQKLPSDVKAEQIDEKLNENKIDMKQAEKIAGKPILTLNEKSGYKLKSVTYLDVKAAKHKEIEQTYEKNGAEALILTTIVFDDNKIPSNKGDLKLDGEKDITIRGKKGTSMEDTIKNISWSEDGFNYSMLIQDPSMNIEQGKKIVESLEHFK